MLRGTMLCLMLALTAAAQVVRVHNHSASVFHGWLRATVDQLPAVVHGEANGCTYAVGRRIGTACWSVDVRCRLQPGEGRAIDLQSGVPVDTAPFELPADILAHFGGWPTVAGVPMALVTLRADAAAVLAGFRARLGRMLCVNVWLTWYPSQPGLCYGEAYVAASNPAVPDMGEAIPPGLTFRFGDAMVNVVGAGLGAPLAAGGELADGQGRAVPLQCIWVRHLRSADDWSTVVAALDLGVGAVGVRALAATGGPLMPPGFSGRAWAAARFPEAVRRLHSWAPPVCGPAPISGSAGEQEDSLLHPGGEALVPDGVGAEAVRYLSAIKLFGERPCNHLEADGTWLDVAKHPSLLFWDGRVHWHPNVSQDRLGKTRLLTADEAHGRWGPDVQHFYQRTLVASAIIKDSPLCQQLLRNLCTVYLLQRTANPSWATSAWESAREWGCEGQFVQDCFFILDDRDMAARVVSRWRERVERILLPRMAGRDLLVTQDRDPRVNRDGLGAQWWQESFASWSIDETCRLVGPAAGREVALRIATRVLDTAWTWAGDHWRAQPQGPIDGSSNDENPATDSFNHYGMPLCVATVLRASPDNAKARAIWTQLLASTGETSRRWMPLISY